MKTRIFVRILWATALATAGSAAVWGVETNAPAADSVLFTLGRRATSVHDPSTIVRCKGQYWVFATGRGIVSRHSSNLVEWAPGPPVFARAPAWTTNTIRGNDGRFWAPDVIFLTNRYLLYYAVSTWGKNTSAIGLAANPTLDPADPLYAWTDCGSVIQTTATNDYNAIDPAVLLEAGGRLWLALGSYWTGIKLIELDRATGKRIAPDSPVYSLAHNDSIEASYIYPRGGYYYLFVDWGQFCRGVRSTYNIRIGRSASVTGPYLDKNGTDMLLGGGSLFLKTQGAFIGPGHAGIVSDGSTDWFSCHFYDGTRNGAPTLGILPLRWDAEGWPQIETQ